MRSIRRDRGRTSSPHYPGLHHDQAGGGDQASDDDYEAKADKLDWFGEKQPLSGLCSEREGGSGKSGSMGKAGDRLPLAMTEAMIVGARRSARRRRWRRKRPCPRARPSPRKATRPSR
jgi:hypothetical protein